MWVLETKRRKYIRRRSEQMCQTRGKMKINR